MGMLQEMSTLALLSALLSCILQVVDCSQKRSLVAEKVTECMFMTSDDGYYEVESQGQDTTCAIYVIKRPDEVVEVEVDKMDVNCDNGGLINLIDGWEMNGQFFPSESDHPLPMRRRFKEVCGTGSPNKPSAALVTNQNAALISYKVPSKEDKFRLKVKTIKNSAPCNVLLDSGEGVFMLQNNNGERSNCSVTSIFPADVQVIETDFVTKPQKHKSPLMSLLSKPRGLRSHEAHHQKGCNENGDYLEIRGGSGLDSDSMESFKTFCSQNSVNGPTGAKEGTYEASVLCGSTTVRLASTGHSYNTVKFSVKAIPLDNPEMMPVFKGDQFFCPMDL